MTRRAWVKEKDGLGNEYIIALDLMSINLERSRSGKMQLHPAVALRMVREYLLTAPMGVTTQQDLQNAGLGLDSDVNKS